MTALANRRVAPARDYRIPILPPDGVGIVTPSCKDRTLYAIPIHAGIGLRIGGEARLCFGCGPHGSVYHPEKGYALDQVLRIAGELGAQDPRVTPAELKAFDAEMRRAYGLSGNSPEFGGAE